MTFSRCSVNQWKSFVSLTLRGRQGKQGSVEELAGSEFLHRKPQAHSTSVAHPRPREAGTSSALCSAESGPQ